MEQPQRSKRRYVECEFDVEEQASLGHELDPTSATTRVACDYTNGDYDSCMMSSQMNFTVVDASNNNNAESTLDAAAPRIRRLRVGYEPTVRVDHQQDAFLRSALTDAALAATVSTTAPVPRVAVKDSPIVPGVDYGPCRLCGNPTGNEPYLPYALIAKFCAAAPGNSLGVTQQLEHSAIIQVMDDSDPQAQIVYSIAIQPRRPFHCECSEKCYIVYRQATFGANSIFDRVLQLIGSYYDDIQLNSMQRAGKQRIMQRCYQSKQLIGRSAPEGLENETYDESPVVQPEDNTFSVFFGVTLAGQTAHTSDGYHVEEMPDDTPTGVTVTFPNPLPPPSSSFWSDPSAPDPPASWLFTSQESAMET